MLNVGKRKTLAKISIDSLLQLRSKVEKENRDIIVELQNVKELAKHPAKTVREYHRSRAKQLAGEVKANKQAIKDINAQIKAIRAK